MQREKVTIPWTQLCVSVCLSLNECTWVCRMRITFPKTYLDYIQLTELPLRIMCAIYWEYILRFPSSFIRCLLSLINSLSAHLMRLIKRLKGWSGIVFGVKPNIEKIIREKVRRYQDSSDSTSSSIPADAVRGRPGGLVCDSVNLLRAKCIYRSSLTKHFDLTHNSIQLTLVKVWSRLWCRICFLISNNFWRFVLILIIYFYVRASLIQ